MKNINTPKFWDKQFKDEYKLLKKMAKKKLHLDLEKIRWANERFSYMSYYIPMNSVVLDVGCGLGHFCRYLKARNFPSYVVGIDFSKQAIKYVRELDSEGAYAVANTYKLPFKDNTFDSVVAGEILEHLEKPEKAVKEWKRVLKPGGNIIITTPIKDSPSKKDSDDHVKEYTVDDLALFIGEFFPKGRIVLPDIHMKPDQKAEVAHPIWMLFVGNK